MTIKTMEERKEMAFVGMDIKLFLRMARTNFTHAKDHEVINKLMELADQWGAGVDIMQPPKEGS